MTLFDLVCYVLTGMVVLSIVEPATLGALVSAEMLGISVTWRVQTSPAEHHGRSAWRLEGAAFLLGQVYVGMVSPYLLVALIAVDSTWVTPLAAAAALSAAPIGLIALGLAFMAGVVAVAPPPRPVRRPGGRQHLQVIGRGQSPEAA